MGLLATGDEVENVDPFDAAIAVVELDIHTRVGFEVEVRQVPVASGDGVAGIGDDDGRLSSMVCSLMPRDIVAVRRSRGKGCYRANGG